MLTQKDGIKLIMEGFDWPTGPLEDPNISLVLIYRLEGALIPLVTPTHPGFSRLKL